tara:strand:+ start:82 stop:825 length:744 start_codon:yes stop_codon:yes gene_type:complete
MDRFRDLFSTNKPKKLPPELEAIRKKYGVEPGKPLINTKQLQRSLKRAVKSKKFRQDLFGEELTQETRLQRLDELLGAVAGFGAKLFGGAAAKTAAGAAAKTAGSAAARTAGSAAAKTAGSAAAKTTLNPAAANRLRLLKKAQQQGLMDKSGKLTGLGQARSYARTKIQGISDPNLRGLATRAMNRGTKMANTAIQSYSAGGARGIARGVLGSAARTAIRNPMMTAAIGTAVAGAMRGKNQSQTGAY